MTKDEIIQFINNNPVFALATVDGNKPRSRYMMTAFADERGIIFTTGKAKDVYKQITANTAIELAYHSVSDQKQLRIEATAQETDDENLKKEIVEKFEFLKPWVDQCGYGVMGTFILKEPRACIWTMETNDAPKEYIDL